MDRAQRLNQIKNTTANLLQGNLGVPLLLIIMLGMMTLQIPAFLLDIFLTFNIALAIVVLMVSIYTSRPLDFAVFPTILLVATLLRLSLNVASTRVVLLYGHESGDAAGKVIEAFGEVLIGGNYAVGLVVFLILMIINFVVVTKGAGRISEVSARFTLDAMPGKQMAIDADLNAGLIDAEGAKDRRQEIASEAAFYGSMDGASKFVKGDAVAGIMILVINIIGGLAIGIGQHDLTFIDAVERYSLLTIGDGLVAQVPSLLLSTAAAIMVTRTNDETEMGTQVFDQMFSTPRALSVAAGLIILLGLLPGMPHWVFLTLGACAAGIAYWIYWQNQKKVKETSGDGETLEESAEAIQAATEQETKELGWDDVEPVDIVGMEVGYRLIPMVDVSQGGVLLKRIKGLRKKLSQELGFLIPSVHIRDNLSDLEPSMYRITLMGVTIGEAEVIPDKELAINPGQVFGTLKGEAVKDPAFGLDAVWIDSAMKDHAQTLGYTVVDASSVVATHLNQILYQHAHELIGHEDVQKMLENLAKSSPKLAEELVPNTVSISVLLSVLQRLLLEHVPVRDLRTIAEALANMQPKSQDPAVLTAEARVSLSRLIVQNIIGSAGEIPVITLDPSMEQLLLSSLQQNARAGLGADHLVLESSVADSLQKAIVDAAKDQELAGRPAVLLVIAPLRPGLAKFMRPIMDSLHVLSYHEVPDSKQVTVVASVGSTKK